MFEEGTRSPLRVHNRGRFVLIPNGQRYNHQEIADSRFLCRGLLYPAGDVSSESATSVVGFLNLTLIRFLLNHTSEVNVANAPAEGMKLKRGKE